MEVLLRETVNKLGNRGDVVNVKPGFARNYLLPKKIAVTVTPGNIKQLEIEKRNYERKQLETKSIADEAKAKLEEMEIVITKRAADNGQLFGSVTRQEVAGILNEKGFEIERRKIEMDHLKELGEYTAKVRLHPEVIAEFKITVNRIEE
ncbi:MAG: 50S ribosomal protein L9 [Acidobacteriota bacterium]|nr:50S ribosomal protein L9 [Acidobacteriota bacterium]